MALPGNWKGWHPEKTSQGRFINHFCAVILDLARCDVDAYGVLIGPFLIMGEYQPS
jgi:hypothetical protein